MVAWNYNALLLNCIRLEIEKTLRKNQNGFRRKQSTTSDNPSNERLYHQVVNGFIPVSLWFKWLSDPVVTFSGKRWWTHKTEEKKLSMKIESPMFAGQREITCHGERKRRNRHWIFFLVFCCSSNILVCWFHLHSCASGVRPLFRAYSKIGAAISVIFTSSWLVFNCCLYLIMSPSQPTLKPEWSPYFCLVLEGGTYLFPVVPLLRRRSGTPCVFFLVIFNYHSHTCVTGWPDCFGLTP